MYFTIKMCYALYIIILNQYANDRSLTVNVFAKKVIGRYFTFEEIELRKTEHIVKLNFPVDIVYLRYSCLCLITLVNIGLNTIYLVH